MFHDLYFKCNCGYSYKVVGNLIPKDKVIHILIDASDNCKDTRIVCPSCKKDVSLYSKPTESLFKLPLGNTLN